MLFNEIVCHRDIVPRLLQMVREQRVGHALLFAGGEGSGSLALALAFARYLNCTDPGHEDSCQQCSSCRKYSRLVHPDLHMVFPVAATKGSGKDPVSDDFLPAWRECVLANPYMRPYQWYEHIGIEKKLGTITRNESLQIIRKLSFRNFEASWKVVIIWMAEKMNLPASNKLLKIIEEPPANTLFILVAEDTSQIIPTIVSRTQVVNIPRIDRDSMRKALSDKHGIEEESQVDGLVRLAEGNYLRLVELVSETSEVKLNFGMFVRLMRLCYSVDMTGILSWVDEMAERGREKHKQFFEYALRMIRGNFIINIRAGDIDFLTPEEKEFSGKFSAFVNERNFSELCEELTKASLHIEYNGYNRLVFFDLAVKIARLLKS